MLSPHTTGRHLQSRIASRATARRGLAPLELVLSLPLLLCVMALIVNFAHAATWKIRSATNARLAMWRHRPMWSADSDPKPINYWPKGASMNVQEGSRIAQVDAIWDQASIAQAWIKGPVFVAGQGYLGVRDNRVNEMSEGVSLGTADVTLRYPFMPSMGNLSIHADHSLLDSVWQFHTMGYASNESRRAKNWWQLEDSGDWANQKQLFLMADDRIRSNPQRELMRPLDRDLDLISRGYSYDFYARQTPICENDPRLVHEMLIAPGGLLDRIRGNKEFQIPGVCERMAKSYLQMYMDELAILKSDPTAPQDRISQLEQWIIELEAFIAKLKSPN